MNDVLDTRPAYTITTSAHTADGTDHGTQTTTVTNGQIAQYRLHLEPAQRTAERIAQGRHETRVKAGASYADQAVSLPLIVDTVSVTAPRNPMDYIETGDVVITDSRARMFDVVGVTDADHVTITSVNRTGPSTTVLVDVAELVKILHGAEYVAALAAGGRELDGRWYGTHTGWTAACAGTLPTGRDGEKITRHDLCNGWVAPGLGGHKMCGCPCHDGYRMPYAHAQAVVQDWEAQDEYERAANRGAGAEVARCGLQWFEARATLLGFGMLPEDFDLAELPWTIVARHTPNG